MKEAVSANYISSSSTRFTVHHVYVCISNPFSSRDYDVCVALAPGLTNENHLRWSWECNLLCGVYQRHKSLVSLRSLWN